METIRTDSTPDCSTNSEGLSRQTTARLEAKQKKGEIFRRGGEREKRVPPTGRKRGILDLEGMTHIVMHDGLCFWAGKINSGKQEDLKKKDGGKEEKRVQVLKNANKRGKETTCRCTTRRLRLLSYHQWKGIGYQSGQEDTKVRSKAAKVEGLSPLTKKRLTGREDAAKWGPGGRKCLLKGLEI